MRAVAAGVAFVAILASPFGFGAFLPGDFGSVASPSPPGPAPPSPHLFPAGPGTRATASPMLIVEVFYYALRDDEYVVLANPRSTAVNLGQWRLTDREGTVEFPVNATLPGGARAVVTRNATSYREDTLDLADYTYGGGAAIAMTVVGRIPLLNNDGDEVVLLDATGSLIDAFVYGASTYAGPGWNGASAAKIPQGKRAVRTSEAGVFRDTDTSADWDSLRSYGLGQSDIPFERFRVSGSAVGFLSPDDSLSVLQGFLDRANRSIHTALYTLTNAVIGDSLLRAVARGVDVQILLEGGPVGGIDEREWVLVGDLVAAGGAVRFLADDPANGTSARYRFLHAKYAIIDSAIVIAGSENWGEHGFPRGSRVGNRGWQIALESVGLAGYFEDVFTQDFDPHRRDSVQLSEFSPNLIAANASASDETRGSGISSSRFSGILDVTPVVAPDHALRPDALLGLLESAVDRLDIEAFYMSKTWGTLPNLYLEASIAAARRGVSVRIILDGTWYNVEGDDPVDNDDTAAYVNRVARQEGLPLEAKIGDTQGKQLSKFHNKGVLVDGGIAFVSSLNWNRNAAMNNREVGLIVRGAEVIEPFRDAFEFDWGNGTRPRGDGITTAVLTNPMTLPLLTLVAVNIALAWAWLRQRRQGRKGLSEGVPSE